MELIVDSLISIKNLKALEDMRSHRERMIEILSGSSGLNPQQSIKQNADELAIIEAGIVKLRGQTML
jgi:hypothetical protein